MMRAAMEYRKQKKALHRRLHDLKWNNWRSTFFVRDRHHWWEA